jgi:hypothetical protein
MTPAVITALVATFCAGLGIGVSVGLIFTVQARTDEVRNLRKHAGNGAHP